LAAIGRLLALSGVLVAFRAKVAVASPSQQRREHRLQSPDEIIGLLVTL
jgi:hypothetical protein